MQVILTPLWQRGCAAPFVVGATLVALLSLSVAADAQDDQESPQPPERVEQQAEVGGEARAVLDEEPGPRRPPAENRSDDGRRGIAERIRERMERLRDVEQRMAEAEREVGELREQGETAEEATRRLDELRQEMRGLTQEMRDLGAIPPGFRRGEVGEPGDMRRRMMRERLNQVRQASERAAVEGREAEARRLEADAARMEENMARMELEFRPGVPPGGPDRLQHLRIAIENLHAAGLHDQARHIEQEARRMMQEAPRTPLTQGYPPPGGGGPPEIRQLREQLQGVEGAMSGVREEVQQLRAEMQELRQLVRKLRAERQQQGRAENGEDRGDEARATETPDADARDAAEAREEEEPGRDPEIPR